MRVLLACMGAWLLWSCEGIQAGDYVVYRVAFERAAQTPNCFVGGLPPDEEQDTSNELTPDTWILYIGPDNEPYLDIGTTTLRGKRGGDQFTFDGHRVDVSVFSDEMGNTQTHTDALTTHVVINVDGTAIEGTFEQTEDRQCSGTGCPEPFNCTTTKALVGSEVEDVELQHEV
ncbi:MAG TPA: hypothetical protein VFB62_08615 [Polyangiaceae bacterium]|jgi:hypothetical protein|nr:hypothetical protein [Polyangiaceae bacterium]